MHHLSLKVFASIPNHTSPTTGSTSSSLRLVANNALRRRNDGFLHLQHSLHTILLPHTPSNATSSMGNITTTRHLETNIIEPLYTPQTVIVRFGSGDALRNFVLKVATPGTILPWIQCHPCRPQARQSNLPFNPQLSPTYSHIPSTSHMCTLPYTHPENHLCAFSFNVPSEMNVKGYLGQDHVVIGESAIENFMFGCSHSTTFFNNAGLYAGVISLSRRPPSLVTQAAASGLAGFSYCLSEGSEMNRQGFLRFGTDIPHNPNYGTTRILPALNSDESEYHLGLIGISLGERKLDKIHPEMFARNKDQTGGCVIDVGTPLTVMVREAYNIIEDAMWADLQHLKVERVQLPTLFGLCFRVTEATKGRLQPLSLHFTEEEAVLVLSPEQLFVMMQDNQGQVACLAMTPGDRTIIGAFQQVDTRFVYDVEGSRLSFASERCILDTTEEVD
ncbi:hypothetical protein QOZ80_7AG0553120 [Eleusine coracana subsp. coracana]|nr:hypothetical protein QOZ80_7AG0553120 [Eleusine coracana subsp. coracana]